LICAFAVGIIIGLIERVPTVLTVVTVVVKAAVST
jgi:hypothetical protein